MAEDTPLKRSPSLPMMVRYALGTTVGAGIDALVGELASMTGYLAPASFRVASLMALLITICFAELSARVPRRGALRTGQVFIDGAGRSGTALRLTSGCREQAAA